MQGDSQAGPAPDGSSNAIEDALDALEVLSSSTFSCPADQSNAAAALSPLSILFAALTALPAPAAMVADTFEMFRKFDVVPKLLSATKSVLQRLVQQPVLQAPTAQLPVVSSICETLTAACMAIDKGAAGHAAEEQKLVTVIASSGDQQRTPSAAVCKRQASCDA
jgi:hypothetical protein